MQYEASTPVEYLELLEEDWRKGTLMELRAILLAQPDIVEGIKYKMLSYADEKGVMFQLNAQKNYVALYVGNASKVDPSGKLLEGIDHGKGCLRFKKSTNPSETQIEGFVKKALDMWKKGEDFDC
ncbi:DUF1801 domain-containing protein [Ekhidna sp. To15]|uniref:DUF1801 domain-containing protein n=1 Tax=Ekhidna sp. To15 TaxID=3395267 RepID=UPI003F52226A